MIAQGQSIEAKTARLERGCCPVHGIGMPQSGRTDIRPRSDGWSLVECPRQDCGAVGWQQRPSGPVDLFLINGGEKAQ